MNLAELLPDTGKLSAIHTADVAIKKRSLIPELLDTAFHATHPMSTRAANTLEIIDSKKPELIKPYYKKIISAFPKFTIDGQKRCLLKIFTRHVAELKDAELCALLNYCFDAMNSSSETVGVKAYSMMILFEISKREPDIRNELAIAISSQLSESQKAFQSLGSRMLVKLKK
jgi:hypothetical protein